MLDRCAGACKVESHLRPVGAVIQRGREELVAGVALEELRQLRALPSCGGHELRHVAALESRGGGERDARARADVDQREDADRAPVLQHVMHTIRRPALVGLPRDGARCPDRRGFPPVPSPRPELHPLPGSETMDALAVERGLGDIHLPTDRADDRAAFDLAQHLQDLLGGESTRRPRTSGLAQPGL